MSVRTATNPVFTGLVESLATPAPVPVELHARNDGTCYASCGSVVPIHCCDDQQIKSRAATTHHYCDIFSEQLLAPLEELAYVRLDDHYAEKVFINRVKRIQLVSSDGVLAQWRAAPTFESSNRFIPGTPILNKDGAVVSVVTARRGNHYAVSTFEGEGGYFETTNSWVMSDIPPAPPAGPAQAQAVYGARYFPTRDELRAHVAALPTATATSETHECKSPTPVLHRSRSARPRIVLVAPSGRQIAHLYLHNVHTDDVIYL